MFRRRRQNDDEADEADEEILDGPLADGDVPAGPPPADAPPAPPPAAPAGPWDSRDAPEDDVPRLDLGCLHVPVPEGLEVRVEVQDDVVVAATFVDGPNLLQVHGFAAPKSAGLWDEVREEIGRSLRESGGSAQDAQGPFGIELAARVPEQHGQTPARFVGVDGPRWFLRGLITGPASTDPVQARRLEEAFRGVVVHRGTDAMAPRDLLPLHLPRDATVTGGPLDNEEEPPSLALPERGPEITEIQ